MCDSGTDDTKVRVYKIRPTWANDYLIAENLSILDGELEGADDGEKWEIEVATMTRHEIYNLPEHEGW